MALKSRRLDEITKGVKTDNDGGPGTKPWHTLVLSLEDVEDPAKKKKKKREEPKLKFINF